MRWRLIVLGCLAVALAVGTVVCANTAVDLSFRAESIYRDGQTQPTQAQMDASTRMSQESWGLSLLTTPLGTGSLVSALAIPAVLGRRWQLRAAEAPRAPSASR